MKRIVLALLVVVLTAAVACTEGDWEAQRARLVEIVRAQGVTDAKVLAAMKKVPRHLFVPANVRYLAYQDHPLPIGHEQTISQPFIVGYMTQALKLQGGEKVLEVGTGSGYQAAVLAEIVKDVYSIEIICALATQAEERLKKLGYTNVHIKCGDGYLGWPEHAPFDGVIVTAAPDHVPQPLIDQLKVGGRLIIPVGRGFQSLLLIIKTADGIKRENLLPVAFVPMTGSGVDGSEE
ncbi:MAG: protein-L-isoaspartate(D-aspartate) O-methyltransferase [Alphaproteobacteria bacterium]